jgi:hypothetical protein
MLRVVTSDWAMAADEAIVRIRARRHGLMAIPFVTSTAQTRSICPVFHAAKRLPETEEELQETEQTYREWIQVSVVCGRREQDQLCTGCASDMCVVTRHEEGHETGNNRAGPFLRVEAPLSVLSSVS